MIKLCCGIENFLKCKRLKIHKLFALYLFVEFLTNEDVHSHVFWTEFEYFQIVAAYIFSERMIFT